MRKGHGEGHGEQTGRLRKVPTVPWRNLKHLSAATKIDYSEAQTFVDILKYKDISKDLGKSFDLLKQHFLSHAAENIQQKGTSRNMNTRVGKGFQQEVSALYCKTNGKNAEHQISVLDENEETMARLDMEVQLWKDSQALESEFEPIPPAVPNPNTHWKLETYSSTPIRAFALGRSSLSKLRNEASRIPGLVSSQYTRSSGGRH
ncbi:hypothetical protein R3P38DRAFT_2812168 [Favolaschia claudopus]|uniref:Uncharacterized protein n=1 Tax=Favolaschia claudopus TaxID=2862362 RepID=A0AAV9Z900_9AGAR